jgi:hypothetical protein
MQTKIEKATENIRCLDDVMDYGAFAVIELVTASEKY